MLEQLGEELVMKQDEAMQAAAPTGRFSQTRVNAFLKALNKVTKLFDPGIPDVPLVSADIKGSMPADVATRLLTITDALSKWEDGMDFELPMVQDIKDNASLAKAIIVLDNLAVSKDFKKFLASPPAEESMGTEGAEEMGMKEEEEPGMSEEQKAQVAMAFGK